MTDQELLIKIKADTDKATKEIKQLNKQVETLSKSSKKVGSSASGIDKLTKSFGGLKKKLLGLGAGLATFASARELLDLTKEAAKAQQTGEAFKKVFEDMGLSAEEEFTKIQEASKGLISEASLKQSATTAVSLGVPIGKLAQLMEVARVKAREMGTDAEKAFSDLATGIGRGSPMILDNLGLTIKLEEANKKHAKTLGITVKEMTKSQKAMALTNAVIESGADSVDRFSDSGLSASQKLQAFNADLADLKVKIGFALLPTLEKLVEQTSAWIDSIEDESIEDFGNSISLMIDGFVGLIKAAQTLNDILLPDWIFGKDAGVLDTAAQGYINLANALATVEKKSKKITSSGGGGSWGDDIAESGKKAKDSVDDVASALDELNNKTDAEKVKDYTSQIQAHASYLNTLIQNEKTATKAITDAHKELNKELKSIAEDRASVTFDTSSKIRDIEISLLHETKQYAAREVEEAKALSNAKIAASKGETEEKERQLKRYEELATASADRLTRGRGSVSATEKQEAQERIKILKNIEEIELAALDAKEKKARDVNQKIVDTQKQELDLIKQKTDAENEYITALAGKIALIEAPTESEHTIKDNASEVQASIDLLKQPTSSVHTIYEKRVPARANGGLIPQKLATGGVFTGSGKVRGYDPRDSDSVNAKLTGGEYVVKRTAVDKIGVATLNAINSLKVPNIPTFSQGGLVGGSTPSAQTPINLNIGGQTFKVSSEAEVAESLQNFIKTYGGL